MGVQVSGLMVSGMMFRGEKTFNSVTGLICDWNETATVDAGGGVVNIIPDVTGNNNSIPVSAPSATGSFLKSGGFLNNSGVARYFSSADNHLRSIFTSQKAFGLYIIGKVDGTSNVIFPIRYTAGGVTGYQFQIRMSDADGSGNPKLRVVQKDASTVTTTNGVPKNTLISLWHRTGPNGSSFTQTLGYNNTSLSTTTRSQSASTTAADLEVILGNAADTYSFKRLLVYDWDGLSGAQVNAADAEVRSLITSVYGIT